METTINVLSTAFAAIIYLILGLTFLRAWYKNKNSEGVESFAGFLLSFGFQHLFFAWGLLVLTTNFLLSGWLWVFGNLFNFIGICYLLRFSLGMRHVSRKEIIFRSSLVVAVLGEILIIAIRPLVKPLLFADGYRNWIVPPPAQTFIGAFATVVALYALWVFIGSLRNLPNKKMKVRSIFLILGLIFFFTSGPAHNFIKSPAMAVFADGGLMLGMLLMSLGVYFPRFLKNPTAEKNQAAA